MVAQCFLVGVLSTAVTAVMWSRMRNTSYMGEVLSKIREVNITLATVAMLRPRNLSLHCLHFGCSSRLCLRAVFSSGKWRLQRGQPNDFVVAAAGMINGLVLFPERKIILLENRCVWRGADDENLMDMYEYYLDQRAWRAISRSHQTTSAICNKKLRFAQSAFGSAQAVLNVGMEKNYIIRLYLMGLPLLYA